MKNILIGISLLALVSCTLSVHNVQSQSQGNKAAVKTPTPKLATPKPVASVAVNARGELCVEMEPIASSFRLLAKSSDVSKIVVSVTGGNLEAPLKAEFDSADIRGNSKASFSNLTAGDYTVSATAFDESDAELGSNSAEAEVKSGKTTQVHLRIVLNSDDKGGLKVGVTVVEPQPEAGKE